MSADTIKYTVKENAQLHIIDTVDENMRDYSKEPAFIKQMERAKATLDRVGLPKELQDRIIKNK